MAARIRGRRLRRCPSAVPCQLPRPPARAFASPPARRGSGTPTVIGPGYARRRSGRGFTYRDEDRSADRRSDDDRPDPVARHPARLDRCLDLSRPGGPPPGDRSRCPGSQAIPLSPGLSIEPRATPSSIDSSGSPRPCRASVAASRRIFPSHAHPREGPRGGRPVARAESDPRGERRVRAAQSLLRPDHAPEPGRAPEDRRPAEHATRCPVDVAAG